MIDQEFKNRLVSYVQIFLKESRERNLDPLLLAAIAIKESSLEPDKYRDEPGFYKRYVKKIPDKQIRIYNPSAVTPEGIAKERKAESASYGLMQVMGLTVRELGFRNANLRDLQEPEHGIKYGAKYFKEKMTIYQGDVEKSLSGYNAGSYTPNNHDKYVVPVIGYYTELKADQEIVSWFQGKD